MNPFLPPAPPDLGPGHTRRHRGECGADFYRTCLELAQSLWLREKPAQAILQLNKAAMVVTEPLPLAALAWFLDNRRSELFIGNPVRHFQHLASRMSGANAEARAWRAWACFHLAREILSPDDFPCDESQLEKEALRIPEAAEVLKNLPVWDLTGLPAGSALARTASVSAHSSTG